MIILPEPTFDLSDLSERLDSPLEETRQKINEAVLACAILSEPLNFQLSKDVRLDTTKIFTRALRWLTENAPFAINVIDDVDYDRVFSDKKWMTNIAALADRHIKANYDRGWDGQDELFQMMSPPISAKDGSLDYQLLELDREKHWPLFTMAVLARVWVDVATVKEEECDPVTLGMTLSFLEGAARQLADLYPVLGERLSGTIYTSLSTSPQVALDL
jgi:hypothetical protein